MITIRNYILSAFLLVSIFGCTAFSQNENDGKVFSVSDASSIGEGKTIKIENNKITVSEDRKKFVASILETATALEGVPYVYAGKSPKGFDCSGFVYYVFKNHDITLPASSRMYDKVGKTITLENAQKGDIICFTGTDPNIDRTGHVGIIVENNANEPIKFIHATSGKRYSVAYSTLSKDGSGHYAKRFRSVRRVDSKK
ncbi:cell wall-associated hydrolase, invasion-associated protein [Bernardetia litoralis DSM 6794]|uniref:Cell wall-associated hydrolase, invasion-associated protein n=1 Tax=Bernardetia litoralis (strain ATCC 23117 / DSM 6794 / NBRC 15988 / NCIMB 1366 / Fx l1 / Sio-4) TaxID=880071 RepID=I4AG08_BERLS|nr:C40 family peptidase [Bernardetia litoralis]AFM02893.1 cell wall-associated hydrolase, invasion-associated protein [Bernardetia litoralis DSM 6794]